MEYWSIRVSGSIQKLSSHGFESQVLQPLSYQVIASYMIQLYMLLHEGNIFPSIKQEKTC